MYQGYIDVVSALSPINAELNKQFPDCDPLLRELSEAFYTFSEPSRCGRRIVYIFKFLYILQDEDLYEEALLKYANLVWEGLLKSECASSEDYLPIKYTT